MLLNNEETKMKVININEISDSKQMIAFNNSFKIMYFDFEVGKGLPNHIHNGYATVQILEGYVDMNFTSGEKFELKAGDHLAFDARVEHNVIAKVKSKVIVTIGKQ